MKRNGPRAAGQLGQTVTAPGAAERPFDGWGGDELPQGKRPARPRPK